jgi:hypothetical protein
MIRWWNERVADVLAVIALPTMLFLLFVAATLVAALWYWYPAWVPRRWPQLRALRWRWPTLRWPKLRWPKLRWPKLRWPRLRWPRWRLRRPSLGWLRWLLAWWRRTPADDAVEPSSASAEEMPEIPATEFVSLADRLAAERRYAEAIRERLRAMVRELIERGVIEHRPGWTVTELATAASQRRPAVAGPLGEGGQIFSNVWYGQQPAQAADDVRMKHLGAALSTSLDAAAAALPPPVPAGAAQ